MQGAASVLFYMTVYVAMTLGAFLVVQRMRGADGEPVETIASLSGLSQTRPWLAAAMAIFMFGLAGIPPLFGFWPKFVVFQAAVAADLAWLAAVAIVTSVISAFYYIMIVKLMYFDEPVTEFAAVPRELTFVLAVSGFLVVTYFVTVGSPLTTAAHNAAGSLF